MPKEIHPLRRIAVHVCALLALAPGLAGCMTTAEEQNILGAALGAGAAGLASGLAGGIHPGRRAAAAAIGGMGTAMMSTAAASTGLTGQAGAGSQGSQPGMATNGHNEPMPDTPACRRFKAYSEHGVHPTMSAAVNHAQLVKMTRLYNLCLASAPNHPTSRKLRCANGKYRMYYVGSSYRGAVCGAEQMAKASAPGFLGYGR